MASVSTYLNFPRNTEEVFISFTDKHGVQRMIDVVKKG